MSQDNNDKPESPLDKALGLQAFITPEVDEVDDDREPIDLVPADYTRADVLEDDVQYSRDNLKKLIKEGNMSLRDLLDFAKQAQNARVYEVAARYMEMMIVANKQFADLALDRKKAALQEASLSVGAGTTTTITNNTLIMTTEEAIEEARKRIEARKNGA